MKYELTYETISKKMPDYYFFEKIK
jgi:hypothetical protein